MLPQLVAEVTDVDTLITPYVQNGRFLFRAPFREYDTRVYDALQTLATSKYVGHVDWDVGGVRRSLSQADRVGRPRHRLDA